MNTHQQSSREIEEAVNDFFAVTRAHPGIDKKKQLTGVIQSLLTSHSEAIRERVIGLRKDDTLKTGRDGSFSCCTCGEQEDCGCTDYNLALDDILALLNDSE